jgi:TetR/AcrR family transcriptional regulator, cholesterol catabolism regulator
VGKAQKRPPTLAMKRTAAQGKDRAQYGAKRELILRAAGPVLQREGINGATMGAIAKEAGVDRATIYYYFEDKHAIFREAIHDGLAEMVADLEDIAAGGDSALDRLRNSMRAVMRAYERHYPHLYIFFQDGGMSSIIDNHLNVEILASGARYEALVEAAVRDGVDSGVFVTPLPPKMFAKLVVGMLNWTSRWFVPGGVMGADDIADGMADTVLKGILVRPGPRRSK